MADKDEKAPKSGSGCIGKLGSLFVFLIIAGLAAAVFQISRPQDLSDIAGRGPSSVGRESRDLVKVLENSIKGGYELTLNEQDINLYLRDTLKAEQGGLLASQVGIEDVVVRLEDDHAEVVMVRSIAGHPFTVSMYLRVVQSELPDGTVLTEILRNRGPYHSSVPRPGVGGRFGRLPVPEGFLLLVMPAFEKLASVYRDADSKEPVRELDFIEEMVLFSIADGKLVLDPRPRTRDMLLPGVSQ